MPDESMKTPIKKIGKPVQNVAILGSGLFYSGGNQVEEAAVDYQEAGEDQEHAENVVGFESFAEDGAGEEHGADRDHQGDEKPVGGASSGDDAEIDDVGDAGAENTEHTECDPG